MGQKRGVDVLEHDGGSTLAQMTGCARSCALWEKNLGRGGRERVFSYSLYVSCCSQTGRFSHRSVMTTKATVEWFVRQRGKPTAIRQVQYYNLIASLHLIVEFTW